MLAMACDAEFVRKEDGCGQVEMAGSMMRCKGANMPTSCWSPAPKHAAVGRQGWRRLSAYLQTATMDAHGFNGPWSRDRGLTIKGEKA